ncbi:MAG TPA: glycine zipper 2TM domain-containing protein, partial [Mizugakiibacter sp.]|nr:glycine zipper 2TM domain-containing protein [Mizugakiibacter sp.]
YDLAQVRPPTQNCYPQRVVTEGHSNTAETLLGAVIGGALGHTMGQGNGRRAATIGGAIIGGVMGNRMGSRPQSSSQTRCRENLNESPRRRIIGYDIEYRYHGDIYMSRLNYDPGDRLRIRINITPAD